MIVHPNEHPAVYQYAEAALCGNAAGPSGGQDLTVHDLDGCTIRVHVESGSNVPSISVVLHHGVSHAELNVFGNFDAVLDEYFQRATAGSGVVVTRHPNVSSAPRAGDAAPPSAVVSIRCGDDKEHRSGGAGGAKLGARLAATARIWAYLPVFSEMAKRIGASPTSCPLVVLNRPRGEQLVLCARGSTLVVATRLQAASDAEGGLLHHFLRGAVDAAEQRPGAPRLEVYRGEAPPEGLLPHGESGQPAPKQQQQKEDAKASGGVGRTYWCLLHCPAAHWASHEKLFYTTARVAGFASFAGYHVVCGWAYTDAHMHHKIESFVRAAARCRCDDGGGEWCSSGERGVRLE